MCQICVLCYHTKTGKRGLFARLTAGIKHLAEMTGEMQEFWRLTHWAPDHNADTPCSTGL